MLKIIAIGPEGTTLKRIPRNLNAWRKRRERKTEIVDTSMLIIKKDANLTLPNVLSIRTATLYRRSSVKSRSLEFAQIKWCVNRRQYWWYFEMCGTICRCM